jgi:plastocyanin
VPRIRFGTLVLSLTAWAFAAGALAQDASYTLTIKDHRFEPAELQVPAGKKIRLLVKNLDATPEEFESPDLKREKVIPGKSEATIVIGPLKPGTYKFVGEFHESTAKGSVVAK